MYGTNDSLFSLCVCVRVCVRGGVVAGGRSGPGCGCGERGGPSAGRRPPALPRAAGPVYHQCHRTICQATPHALLRFPTLPPRVSYKYLSARSVCRGVSRSRRGEARVVRRGGRRRRQGRQCRRAPCARGVHVKPRPRPRPARALDLQREVDAMRTTSTVWQICARPGSTQIVGGQRKP